MMMENAIWISVTPLTFKRTGHQSLEFSSSFFTFWCFSIGYCTTSSDYFSEIFLPLDLLYPVVFSNWKM